MKSWEAFVVFCYLVNRTFTVIFKMWDLSTCQELNSHMGKKYVCVCFMVNRTKSMSKRGQLWGWLLFLQPKLQLQRCEEPWNVAQPEHRDFNLTHTHTHLLQPACSRIRRKKPHAGFYAKRGVRKRLRSSSTSTWPSRAAALKAPRVVLGLIYYPRFLIITSQKVAGKRKSQQYKSSSRIFD